MRVSRKRAAAAVAAAAVAVTGVAGAASAAPAPKPPNLSFRQVAVHPGAAAQPTETGKQIADLAFHNRQLWSGYGDYDANTGPIEIRPLDPTTGEFGDVQVMANTEQVARFRSIDGALYAPMIDPTGAGGSYVSDVSGTWAAGAYSAEVARMVHTYDVATDRNGDLFMAGSANAMDGSGFAGATLKRSQDGGATWETVLVDTDADPARRDGFERFYWIANVGGNIVVRAHSVDGAKMWIWDGSEWTSRIAGGISINGIEAGVVGSFWPNLTANIGPNVFVGSVASNINGWEFDDAGNYVAAFSMRNPGVGWVRDFYEAPDGYTYMIGDTGIARAKDRTGWELVGSAPRGARSVAVDEAGYVWVGGDGGKISKSSKPVPGVVTVPDDGADDPVKEDNPNKPPKEDNPNKPVK